MAETLPQLLRSSTSKSPERTAVEDAERSTALTYRELSRRALALRDRLVLYGVVPGDRIGIYAPKSVGTVAAIFGILEARAAYVPVDYGAPPQRNAGIFDDCTVRFLVIAEELLDGFRRALPEQPLDVLEQLEDGLVLVRGFDGVAPAGSSPEEGPSSDDIAYILYTSGSTGKAKGVVHTHRTALSFIDWCSETFKPTEDDRFSSHAPFHFDLSILDLYVPLKHGATLVLFGEDVGKQPLRLAP